MPQGALDNLVRSAHDKAGLLRGMPEGVADWSEYVLAPFTPAQLEQVEAIIPQMVDAVTQWVKGGAS